MLRPAGPFDVRPAEPADGPSLARLEWLAPDAGSVGLRMRLRRGYLATVDRYPNTRSFVAVDRRGSLVGTISSSVGPTRCAGRVVSGVYLFSLRVDPAVRHRGIGKALVQHAWEEARGRAEVEIGWAGVMGGNLASARTFASSGFSRERDLPISIVPRLAVGWAGPFHAQRGTVVRHARAGDLDQFIAALATRHARHQFYRPLDVDTLRHELAATGGSIDDLWLALGPDGEIRAAGLVVDLARPADVRIAGLRRLPGLVRSVVEPIVSRMPIRPLLLRHAFLGSDTAYLVRRLLLGYGGATTALSLVVDPRDPAWPTVRSLPAVTGRVSIVIRGTAMLDPTLPLAPL